MVDPSSPRNDHKNYQDEKQDIQGSLRYWHIGEYKDEQNQAEH
jgi:hypothetical protein